MREKSHYENTWTKTVLAFIQCGHFEIFWTQCSSYCKAKQIFTFNDSELRCAKSNAFGIDFPTICIPHIFSVHYVTLDITQSPHLRLFPERVLASPHPLWYQRRAQTPASWTVWSLPFISNSGCNLVPISARCLDANHGEKKIYLMIHMDTFTSGIREETGEIENTHTFMQIELRDSSV